jgi:predicted transcriptional regulator
MSVPLSALLSQALIAFTLDFDKTLNEALRSADRTESAPSLAMWSNVLRFVGQEGIERRRLPEVSGISMSAIKSMVSCLERHGWVVVAERQPHTVRLTQRGTAAAAIWQRVLADVERDWERRFGDSVVALRAALEAVVDSRDSLPYYPMPLPNRGANPTGN